MLGTSGFSTKKKTGGSFQKMTLAEKAANEKIVHRMKN